ncbi:Na(+)/H(+) antiporter subunit B [Marinicella gelatinilytica]|uniref:Na(+)/H(+) antiporter subunit B n=1 Tax=Marinicella gelatinilytica TaxID=2996017 RepID=UPI002260B84C|nr:Na(+)/H(+) antiporter subunit B [Marinicella gelatinilytica]MCX7545862.1 Na(+)/H(+) antiporter subunit B [Marinicella gelatinilytica]
MVGVVVAIIWMKDLIAVVMLLGIYGLLTASFFMAMDAVDVAFTEASVGAGISTLLLLVAIAKTKRKEHPSRHKPLLALLVVVITGGLLIYGTYDMPIFGMADAPAHTHVAQRYIEDSYDEIGIPNIVTSVLSSYRGFDTFGEVVVIFTAGLGIIGLLSTVNGTGTRKKLPTINDSIEDQHIVLRIVGKILIPFILLFALYVQFHGEYGPGGGFQAGVIFGAGIILYAMLFGMDIARRVISQSLIQLIAAFGVLLYGAVGVVSFLNGGTFLDYNVLLENPVAGQHLGILLIELGVGMTVASVIIIIFFNFAGRKGPQQISDDLGA